MRSYFKGKVDPQVKKTENTAVEIRHADGHGVIITSTLRFQEDSKYSVFYAVA
jgi:molybdopterin-binding protein